ncbi:membrane protein involved in colicin uptake [Sphingomonas sp. SORGH_AS 879]|nr:membrane protein involved in colicin uptake [Sphingomonas sp. SORGH_AS_0879]
MEQHRQRRRGQQQCLHRQTTQRVDRRDLADETVKAERQGQRQRDADRSTAAERQHRDAERGDPHRHRLSPPDPLTQ